VREGVRLLRTTTGSVEEIAQLVGYRSSNKFYGRTDGYTGLKPSQVRTLEDGVCERMLDECIPLWVPQLQRQEKDACRRDPTARFKGSGIQGSAVQAVKGSGLNP
jgi:hypothetical protein